MIVEYFKKKKLTILATNSVLNGSVVAFGTEWGSPKKKKKKLIKEIFNYLVLIGVKKEKIESFYESNSKYNYL